MCCHERAPRSPALRCFAKRLVRREPGVGVPESEIRRRKGVRLPQPEGDVVRRPRAETVQGCERSYEAVERDAAVEAHAVLDDGAGERADCFTTSRHEADARVVGAGKRRGRRERVREPQRLEPRHTSAEPLDEAPTDRVRRCTELLPDDRAHSQFERAPRPRRAHARALTDQPPDDLSAARTRTGSSTSRSRFAMWRARCTTCTSSSQCGRWADSSRWSSPAARSSRTPGASPTTIVLRYVSAETLSTPGIARPAK